MGDGFIKVLRAINTKKRPLAWVTFLFLVISPFVVRAVPEVNPGLFYAAVFAFAASILGVCLDIHKAVTEVRCAHYRSLNEAWPDMATDILKALGRRATHVVWLGVTLGDAWPRLYELLERQIEQGDLKNLTLDLYQASPVYLRTLVPHGEALALRTEGTMAAIHGFQPSLEKGGAVVTVWRYSYMPNLHGLLVNNSILYLSTVRWAEGNLNAAEEPYERHDSSDDLGRRRLIQFNSWLQRASSESGTSGTTTKAGLTGR